MRIQTQFKNASHVFDYFYPTIDAYGADFYGTKALFNVGFTIEDPLDRKILAPYRNFSDKYAEAEWEWYMSGDRSIDKLGEIYGKVPPIWEHMADWRREVNSNYGWQWHRGNQLEKTIKLLKDDPSTRRAVVSIYDGKEMDDYAKDTPCTYALNFTILNGKLNMSALMRSNDLWFGFCNDQFCFSSMQEMVATRLGIPVGTYYHYATNLHLYERHYGKTP